MTKPVETGDPVRQFLIDTAQRIQLGNEREQEDGGSADATLSAWSIFATVAQLDAPRLIAMVAAVLDIHELRLYDRWHRVTEDPAKAVSAWCNGCGRNIPPDGCPTRQRMVETLRELTVYPLKLEGKPT